MLNKYNRIGNYLKLWTSYLIIHNYIMRNQSKKANYKIKGNVKVRIRTKKNGK